MATRVMPNRIIRDSIRTSDSLSRLTAEEERHFYRLLVYADDFGRFDARPEVVLGQCYPLAHGKITPADVDRWTTRLGQQDVAILVLYSNDGRPYGAFRKWDKYQRIRNAKSKFPSPPQSESLSPPIDSNLQQDAPVTGTGTENGTGDEKLAASAASTQPVSSTAWEPPDFFQPLTELIGYQHRDYAKTAEKFRLQCQEAGVSVHEAIREFAEFYRLNRVKYQWGDPVSACRRNLGRSIKNVERRNGKPGNDTNSHKKPERSHKERMAEYNAARGKPA